MGSSCDGVVVWAWSSERQTPRHTYTGVDGIWGNVPVPENTEGTK